MFYVVVYLLLLFVAPPLADGLWLRFAMGCWWSCSLPDELLLPVLGLDSSSTSSSSSSSSQSWFACSTAPLWNTMFSASSFGIGVGVGSATWWCFWMCSLWLECTWVLDCWWWKCCCWWYGSPVCGRLSTVVTVIWLGLCCSLMLVYPCWAWWNRACWCPPRGE